MNTVKTKRTAALAAVLYLGTVAVSVASYVLTVHFSADIGPLLEVRAIQPGSFAVYPF